MERFLDPFFSLLFYGCEDLHCTVFKITNSDSHTLDHLHTDHGKNIAPGCYTANSDCCYCSFHMDWPRVQEMQQVVVWVVVASASSI